MYLVRHRLDVEVLCFFASCKKRLCLPTGETVTSHGSIEPDKDIIREEPYSLPQGFSWDTLDLGNPAVVRSYIHRNNMRNSPLHNNSLQSLCFFVISVK